LHFPHAGAYAHRLMYMPMDMMHMPNPTIDITSLEGVRV